MAVWNGKTWFPHFKGRRSRVTRADVNDVENISSERARIYASMHDMNNVVVCLKIHGYRKPVGHTNPSLF